MTPQQTVALMPMTLYSQTRNLRHVEEDESGGAQRIGDPEWLEELKNAANEQRLEFEGCVSIAKALYNMSGAEQV